MKDPIRMVARNTGPKRSPCRWGASLALVAVAAGCLGGCPDDLKAKEDEFRAASATTLESGLKSLATGFIEGLFAVYEPDNASGTTDAGTGTDAGN